MEHHPAVDRRATSRDTRVVNMNHLGRALTEYDDPPVERAVRLQLQSGGDGARSAARHPRPRAGGSVHRRVRTGDDRHGAVRRRRPAGDDVSRRLRLRQSVRADQHGAWRFRSSTPSAKRDRTPTCSAICARGSDCSDEGEPTGELDLMLHVLDALPGTIGDDLGAGRRPLPPFGDAPIQFVDVFPNTPDRKVDLFPAALDASAPMGLHRFQPDPGTDRYPLALISPASDRTISSTLGELPRADVEADDASRRCGEARPGGRRPGAGVQRARRGALPRQRESARSGRAR